MNQKKLEILKKESDRVWSRKGGKSDDLSEPDLELSRKERLAELRKKYEMREKDRQKKKKARTEKRASVTHCETIQLSLEN